MTKFALLFFWIAIMSMNSLKGQVLNYHVIKGNKTIGSMTCKRIVQGDEILFNIESETRFKIIFTLSISYTMYERFVNGTLREGNAISTLNGDVQKESYVTGDGAQYKVILDEIPKQISDHPITFSVPQLYFSEPINRKQVFSQQFATFLKIDKTSDRTYTMSSEDGKNIYKYNEDGICQEVKVSRAYANFYFRLID